MYFVSEFTGRFVLLMQARLFCFMNFMISCPARFRVFSPYLPIMFISSVSVGDPIRPVKSPSKIMSACFASRVVSDYTFDQNDVSLLTCGFAGA